MATTDSTAMLLQALQNFASGMNAIAAQRQQLNLAQEQFRQSVAFQKERALLEEERIEIARDRLEWDRNQAVLETFRKGRDETVDALQDANKFLDSHKQLFIHQSVSADPAFRELGITDISQLQTRLDNLERDKVQLARVIAGEQGFAQFEETGKLMAERPEFEVLNQEISTLRALRSGKGAEIQAAAEEERERMRLQLEREIGRPIPPTGAVSPVEQLLSPPKKPLEFRPQPPKGPEAPAAPSGAALTPEERAALLVAKDGFAMGAHDFNDLVRQAVTLDDRGAVKTIAVGAVNLEMSGPELGRALTASLREQGLPEGNARQVTRDILQIIQRQAVQR